MRVDATDGSLSQMCGVRQAYGLTLDADQVANSQRMLFDVG